MMRSPAASRPTRANTNQAKRMSPRFCIAREDTKTGGRLEAGSVHIGTVASTPTEDTKFFFIRPKDAWPPLTLDVVAHKANFDSPLAPVTFMVDEQEPSWNESKKNHRWMAKKFGRRKKLLLFLQELLLYTASRRSDGRTAPTAAEEEGC